MFGYLPVEPLPKAKGFFQEYQAFLFFNSTSLLSAFASILPSALLLTPPLALGQPFLEFHASGHFWETPVTGLSSNPQKTKPLSFCSSLKKSRSVHREEGVRHWGKVVLDFLGIPLGWEHVVVLFSLFCCLEDNTSFSFFMILHLNYVSVPLHLFFLHSSIESQDIRRVTVVVRAVDEQKGISMDVNIIEISHKRIRLLLPC